MSRWQAEWDRADLYLTREDRDRPKFYVLEMFPYPSGDGLSVGHLHNYVPCDVIGRYKRMAGYNVLHAMGWDAFGLPAENDALLKGLHPKETVPRYAANFKRQLKLVRMRLRLDARNQLLLPEYYRWTQWFFLLMLKRGLAFRAIGSQWWCEKCRTILANEQVINGCCWRHTDNPVTKKDLEQWFFKITAYADRLLDDLEGIDWPEPIKLMQRNWVGRSEGAELAFPVDGHPGKEVRFFTTRPDTVFGVSFMVLAPEHPLVAEITTAEQRAAVEEYVTQARRQSEIERLSTVKEKTGVFTGAYARNRFNGKQVPIWIADYVLMGYGTGAIMGAPGEDQRDYDFANKYGLEIPLVTAPADGSPPPAGRAFSDYGININSSSADLNLNGMKTADALRAVCKYAEEHEIGRSTVTYRMRDWLISRQRYWGCPIPIVYCPRDGVVPVPEAQLPVLLPDMKNYQPSGTGRSPLANSPDFVNTTCPKCGGPAERETDTLDGFACSSWYFLRFASPHYDRGPFEPAMADYWLPVDLYVGGAEHAVMHLLYARMWTKVMFDAGLIKFKEPFAVLRNQGIIWASRRPEDVQEQGQRRHAGRDGRQVRRRRAPAVGALHGPVRRADQLERGRRGRHRALSLAGVERDAPLRRGRMSRPEIPAPKRSRRAHKTIRTVTDHLERLRFNTALATMMDQLNYLHGSTPEEPAASRSRAYVLMLAPMAPHIAEELWRAFGHGQSVHLEPWPKFMRNWRATRRSRYSVQVNGKVRDRLLVPAGGWEEANIALALASERSSAISTASRQRKSSTYRTSWSASSCLIFLVTSAPPCVLRATIDLPQAGVRDGRRATFSDSIAVQIT